MINWFVTIKTLIANHNQYQLGLQESSQCIVKTEKQLDKTPVPLFWLLLSNKVTQNLNKLETLEAAIVKGPKLWGRKEDLRLTFLLKNCYKYEELKKKALMTFDPDTEQQSC